MCEPVPSRNLAMSNIDMEYHTVDLPIIKTTIPTLPCQRECKSYYRTDLKI